MTETARSGTADPVEPRRLAVYGSLAPGQPNHHRLAHLVGTWCAGTVRGWLHDRGWGAGVGYPGLEPDPAGPAVAVRVLESDALAGAWASLDAFEGEEYCRMEVEIELEDGRLVRGWIYALAPADRTCGGAP